MSLLDDIPKRKWVPVSSKDYLTIKELSKETGETIQWCSSLATQMVEEGKWEIAWKRLGKPVRAFGRKERKAKK